MTGVCGDCGDCGDVQGRKITREVDERTGLLNVVTLLSARVPDTLVVTFSKADPGHYRVTFDYHARAVQLLKSSVPAAVRRWRDNSKCWEVNVDWAGPLVGALRNAGVDVTGLDEFEEAELFWWCLSPVPISKGGHRAYLKGFCVTCTQQAHRPGGLECDRCYRKRVLRQHRVRTVLAAKGLAPYPRAVPSAGSARRCRVPVCVHDDETPGVAPDYTAAVDAVILAARDDSPKPPCPICGGRPAKGAVVHIGCRRRLLALLADRPFTRPRNAAFQAGLCTVCLARPHLPPGRITCEHCHGLAREVKARSAKGDQPT
jgi:hypothetical protein